MSYINNLMQKTFKRRIGKNVGTLVAIALGVSLMVGVQITITSFSTTAIDFFVEAIGENDILISGLGFPITDYESIIETIDDSSIDYAALNVRVTQDVAAYNLESGILEKGISFTGIELNEDPIFGKFYDENSTEINRLDLMNYFQNKSHVLVGYSLKDELNVTVGSDIKIRIGEFDGFKFNYITHDLKVAGFVGDEGKGKELGGWAIWTSIENIRSIIGYAPNVCTEMNIALSENHKENPVTSEYALEVEEQLKVLLDAENTGLLIIAFRALLLDTAEEVLSDVLVAFNLFGALIIFSGILLLVNIQLIQVEDRIQQLGILRAIGSRRREIVRLFLVESTILGILGSLLGVGGGYGMSVFLVDRIGKTFFDRSIGLQPTVTGGAVIYSIVLGLILSVGAGILPAIRAARVDVIEVIRGIKKVSRKRSGSYSLGFGIGFIISGIAIFAAQMVVYDSLFSIAGWDTAVEQWMFMGAAIALLIGISIILGYLLSKKIMANGIGLTFIGVTVMMLMFSLPQLKSAAENSKILGTLAVVLALGSIVSVGVNLKTVTNFIRGIMYKTKLKKGVSLISSKYMTSKSMRSTLTFGIFTLVLTMNIFAAIYQSTYSYNTLESVEFLSGGAPIFLELDTPISNETLVNVEQDLYAVDGAITNVKGINSTIAFIESDPEVSELHIPSDIFPTYVHMIYNNTFKDGDEYVFDFMFDLSLPFFFKDYKPAAPEDYQREYSHSIWDFFYNRTKFSSDGTSIDNVNGLPTVISTSPIVAAGDRFNLTGLFTNPTEVIVIASVRQYPFSQSRGLPALLITPDFTSKMIYNFALFPKHTRYLISTSEDFREGRNTEIATKIEEFFNSNTSVLVQSEDFVAASSYNVWDVMIELVDFQVKTFDFLQYFVSFGLVVGALGMIIIAVRNVSERRREIGMMRAIGYRKQQIIWTIMLELIILAFLGLIMGFLNSVILGLSFTVVYDWLLIIPATRVLLYTGIMIGIAMVASILPGIRSSQITPAEAIRYVG
ncbi:MAG: FtsX-like permease family protein [Candidatus Heimdallarchaeota archaeon]|nr:FtsX-like permease family protein [Candidatus Heimdallarchaeota archaeon]